MLSTYASYQKERKTEREGAETQREKEGENIAKRNLSTMEYECTRIHFSSFRFAVDILGNSSNFRIFLHRKDDKIALRNSSRNFESVCLRVTLHYSFRKVCSVK